MFARKVTRSLINIRRNFSELAKSSATPAPAVSTEKIAASKSSGGGGSSFLQRLSSFFVGCGVGFGISYYSIYTELVDSNEKFEADLKDIRKK